MTTRRFKRVPALLVLILVLGALAALTAWWVRRTPASPFDGEAPVAAAPTAELVSRGEYVARLGDCVACHSTPQGKPFAGGLKMGTPLGAIYTTNITPDLATGIGSYSLADFDRALRRGVAADGHRLYPAMPYPSYAKLSDEDVRALYAFFMRGVTPVKQADQASEIPWPLNLRWPLALWNSVFTEAGSYQPRAPIEPALDADLWNRGAYIVQGAGHCGSCHTPRGMAMNEKALSESGPLYLSGALLDGWYAPSLRGDGATGLGRWSEDEVVQFLKVGRNTHAVVFGSMTEAFNNSTQFMSDNDLLAIAHYLKSLPGDGATAPAAPSGAPVPESTAKLSGMKTFAAKCAACHGANGAGQAPWIPPLAGATSSMVPLASASAINVTLNGSARVVAAGVPDAFRMPAFRDQLSDQEIADVLTYVRGSWGNRGGGVKPDAVKALREETNPARSDVIVLQMR